MRITNASIQFSAVLLIGLAAGWTPANADEGDIGLYGTVEGTVIVAHPGTLGRPVKVQEPVLFQDMIETQHESRTKALFDDDSILTVGENSKVQITEYVYNPNQNIRSAVVHLLEGRLRALVAKAFKGPGSKFEIHTPTAVAAARGTYFVVWSEGGKSGMVNIGEEGKVDFTAAGKTVTVAPGHYSVALPGQPPSQPAVYQPVQDSSSKSGNASNKTDDSKQTPYVVAKEVEEDDDDKGKNRKSDDKEKKKYMKWAWNAVKDTKVKDRPKFEKPMDVLRALRHDAGASTRVLAKLDSDQPGRRLRNDRKLNSLNDNGSGNGNDQDSENNKDNGNNNANGNNGGKGDGGTVGDKGPVAKVGDVPNGENGGDSKGGEPGKSDGNNHTLGTKQDGNNNSRGNQPESPKEKSRGHHNGNGPQFASPNQLGGGLGKMGPAVLPTTPMTAPMVASPTVTPPMTSPVIGAPVTPVVPVTPPVVVWDSDKYRRGNSESNRSGSGSSSGASIGNGAGSGSGGGSGKSGKN